MSLKFSTLLRNGRADTIQSVLGTAPLLVLYSGSPSANCAAAAPAGTLAILTLPSSWMAPASGGAKALAGSWTGPASGTGTTASWRLYDTTGTTCHAQGSVTATGGGGDLQLDNTSIATGQSVTISTFVITEGNA